MVGELVRVGDAEGVPAPVGEGEGVGVPVKDGVSEPVGVG